VSFTLLTIGLAAALTAAPSSASATNACPGGAPKLKYYGGPVLSRARIIEVNWGSSVATVITQTMPSFYGAIVKSGYFDWLSEYNTVGLNGTDAQPGSNQGISRPDYIASVTITPSLCSSTTACTVTVAQVGTELVAQITAGVVPAPGVGCEGLPDTVYMVHFPVNVTIDQDGNKSCQFFCYTRANATYNGRTFDYAVLPDVTTGPCAGGCGSSTTPINNQTSVATAALVGAITDSDVSGANVARPLAWYDPNCGQISDICANLQATINVNGTTWTVQKQWSNRLADCITTAPTLPPICIGAGTPAGCRVCTCADENEGAAGQIGCSGATPRCETLATNVKNGQCVACTADAQCNGGTCTKSADVTTDDMCVGGGGGAGGAAGGGGAGGRGGSGGAAGAGGAGGAASAGAGGSSAGGATAAGAGGSATAGSGAGGHPDGTEGGACYGNGTCNTGLTCLSHLCVMAPKSSGGCGCAVGSDTPAGTLGLVALALLALVPRRRRTR
jgi:MYXO-CTERM domain-containing protein